MGAWGPALFSDDLACDVRDEYKDLIAEGISTEEATKKFIDTYCINKEDIEDYNVFWLSLAATQWKIGRLTDEAKEKALEIIHNGTDLERWQEEGEPGWAKQREKLLLKLQEQLNSPQPEPKKVKQQYKSQTDLEVGDAISYQLNSGNYVIFRVIGHHTDNGGTHPVCELCDWIGKEIPIGREIEKLQTVKESYISTANRIYSKFILGQLSPKDYPNPRTKLVAKGLALEKKSESVGAWGFLWKSLDSQLEEIYKFS